jgi:plasmid stabilization system protein ParE
MPQVILTAGALAGLERCRQFLAKENPAASRAAAATIKSSLQGLKDNPELGRPREAPELRELLISFGASGYAALYRYSASAGVVHVLAVRHQKEAGY